MRSKKEILKTYKEHDNSMWEPNPWVKDLPPRERDHIAGIKVGFRQALKWVLKLDKEN
jgi:hypothetical protein